MRNLWLYLKNTSRGKIILVVSVTLMVLVFFQMSWMNMDYIATKVGNISPIRALAGSYAEDQTDVGNENPPCIDRFASRYGRVEDIFCQVLPEFLPHLKNPCFVDYNMHRKGELRCLPYFYVIGMDKCGSTDLHSRMAEHPLIMGNKGVLDKETQFWSWTRYGVFNKRKGDKKLTLEDYLNMFSDTARMISNTNMTTFITGDATPMDLWDFRSWPMIPQNEGKKEPEILTPHFLKYLHKKTPKFLIQFREPIERLYSDYIFLQYGQNPLTFHKHALEAIDIMNNCTAKHSRRLCYFSDAIYNALPARIQLGCYSIYLKEWFKVFPRRVFHITRTDEYQNNMEKTLRSVFSFLDLPPLPAHKMEEIINQTRRHVTKKKKGVILPETQDALRKFYDQCNRETAEMLGDDAFLWQSHYS